MRAFPSASVSDSSTLDSPGWPAPGEEHEGPAGPCPHTSRRTLRIWGGTIAAVSVFDPAGSSVSTWILWRANRGDGRSVRVQILAHAAHGEAALGIASSSAGAMPGNRWRLCPRSRRHQAGDEQKVMKPGPSPWELAID